MPKPDSVGCVALEEAIEGPAHRESFSFSCRATAGVETILDTGTGVDWVGATAKAGTDASAVLASFKLLENKLAVNGPLAGESGVNTPVRERWRKGETWPKVEWLCFP